MCWYINQGTTGPLGGVGSGGGALNSPTKRA